MILATAQRGFVDAMSMTSLLGIGIAIAGAMVAFVFMPDRVTAVGTGSALEVEVPAMEDGIGSGPAVAPVPPVVPTMA